MTSINLDAHYTDNPKTQRSKKTILNAPKNLPMPKSYNVNDVDVKLNAINCDIYESSKKVKKKKIYKFLKTLLAISGAIVLVWQSKNIINSIKKFFKKS
ncbi:hypothetical protein J6R97_08480 [bacterium]|nr:hypothetical protein [bacterium]